MSTNSIRKNLTPRSNRQIALLALGLCIVLAILLTKSFRPNSGSPTVVPPDFQLAAKVDLATRSYDGETIAQFTLEETAVVSIYYTIPNIDITYFNLSLIGPENDSFVILHSKNYHTDKTGGGMWEKSLEPGTYQLALTTDTGSGVLSVYWGYSSNIK
ncbi:MAG: hypothetical protein IAF02_07445 [Anaerolineae bacterium]|nr:hypothetical protein [Anaerolineae bacterium]